MAASFKVNETEEFSLVLNLEVVLEIEDVRPVTFDSHRTSPVNLTVLIFSCDSTDLTSGCESQKQEVLVRNIGVVKGPSNRVVPSLVGFPNVFTTVQISARSLAILTAT